MLIWHLLLSQSSSKTTPVSNIKNPESTAGHWQEFGRNTVLARFRDVEFNEFILKREIMERMGQFPDVGNCVETLIPTQHCELTHYCTSMEQPKRTLFLTSLRQSSSQTTPLSNTKNPESTAGHWQEFGRRFVLARQ